MTGIGRMTTYLSVQPRINSSIDHIKVFTIKEGLTRQNILLLQYGRRTEAAE